MKPHRRKFNHSHAAHHANERRGLKRWQKNVIHFGLLALITFALWREGAKLADLGFLFLSLVTEFS